MIDIHDIKKLLSIQFAAERNKQRLTDKEKNMELVRFLGDALTGIEMSIKADLKRIENGEHIDIMYPDKKQDPKQPTSFYS